MTALPAVLVSAALVLSPWSVALAQNAKVHVKDALSPSLQEYVNQVRHDATDQANQKNDKVINDLRQQLKQANDEKDRWQKIAAAGSKAKAAADNASQRLAKAEGELEVARKQLADTRQAFSEAQAAAADATRRRTKNTRLPMRRAPNGTSRKLRAIGRSPKAGSSGRRCRI